MEAKEADVLEKTSYKVSYETDLHDFKAGEIILNEGDGSSFACKLLVGTAKVIREGDVVATIKAGEYFGAIAALTGGKRAATVIAVERCIVENISNKAFQVMVQNNPELLDKIC